MKKGLGFHIGGSIGAFFIVEAVRLWLSGGFFLPLALLVYGVLCVSKAHSQLMEVKFAGKREEIIAALDKKIAHLKGEIKVTDHREKP